MDKACFKCGAVKSLTDFYKHKAMKDGHLNKCKTCTKDDARKHRDDNLEKVKEYDRNRPNKVERSVAFASYVKDRRSQDQDFKDKLSSRSAVSNALRDNRLVRPESCEHCQKSYDTLEGHHWSYKEEHWLDVIWLCVPCHGKEHVRLNSLSR